MNDIRQQAKLAYDRNLAQKNLKERMLSRMIFAYEGGLWVCDQSLISLLNCYLSENEIVLLDTNDIPRKINPTNFLLLVKQRHQECLNEWLVEYQKLSRIRTAGDA